jgi:hypothetical protein
MSQYSAVGLCDRAGGQQKGPLGPGASTPALAPLTAAALSYFCRLALCSLAVLWFRRELLFGVLKPQPTRPSPQKAMRGGEWWG